MLKLEAKELADEYGVTDFEGSWSWLKAFKARHRLCMRARTHAGQKTPADLAAIAANFVGVFCHNAKSRHQKGL
jgi:hypothetical protein